MTDGRATGRYYVKWESIKPTNLEDQLLNTHHNGIHVHFNRMVYANAAKADIFIVR